MKVLLNLVSSDASFDKSAVTDWVQQYMAQHTSDSCTIITPQLLPLELPNIEQAITKPPENNSAFYFWKKLNLEPMVRKQDCDLVITWELLRQGASARQVLVISPVSPVILNHSGKKRRVPLRQLDKVKDQCKQIVVFSELERKWITQNYPHLAGLVYVIYRIPSLDSKCLDFDERELFKEKYADGNEFFIAPDDIGLETLTVLLKGFTGFKKWQKSNMKLLLSYASEDEGMSIKKLLEHYRFNDSIKLISKENEDFSKVLASSYAAILPEKYDSNFDFLFAAFQSQVPVLIPEGSIYSEVAGDAALVYASNEKEFITKVFLQIFKEEGERNRMIKSGTEEMDKWNSYNPSRKFFNNH